MTVSDFTYELKLGYIETNLDEVEKCKKIGIPHYEAEGRFYMTREGKPMMIPDQWENIDNSSIITAPFPKGTKVTNIVTDEEIVV